MKILFGASVALILGGLVGCGSSDDRDRRTHDEQRYEGDTPISRGGPKDDWNRLHSDPVCGHSVNPRAALSEPYGGKTYYFHSDECLKAFRDNPTAYFPDYDDRRTDEERRRDREVR